MTHHFLANYDWIQSDENGSSIELTSQGVEEGTRMLKKAMLLALATSALVAFAAPVAQADEWYTDGIFFETTVGTTKATGDTVEMTGSLASFKTPLRNGPCPVHAQVILWNAGGTAAGEVESLNITANPKCQVYILNGMGVFVPVPGCGITEVETTAYPWTIDVTGTILEITGTNFSNTYEGCAALGIPNGAKIGASGTATGNWSNEGEGGCIEFSESGDLKNAGGESVTLSGSVCKSDITLK